MVFNLHVLRSVQSFRKRTCCQLSLKALSSRPPFTLGSMMVDRALRRTGKSWVTGSDLFGTNSHNRTVIRKNVRLEPSIDDSSSPECIERDVNVLDPPPFFWKCARPLHTLAFSVSPIATACLGRNNPLLCGGHPCLIYCFN